MSSGDRVLGGVSVAELRARVAERYDRLGLAGWPPPRDPMASPEDWEYSRVSDRDKYLVLHGRGRVWAEVLAELPGVSARGTDVSPMERSWRAPDRAVVVERESPGSGSLVLLEIDGVGDGVDALVPVLQVALAGEGTGPLIVTSLPECGCDACDDGSEYYLEALDAAVVRILTEPVVVLEHEHWRTDWSPSGWSHGGDRPVAAERAVAWCEAIAAGEHVELPPGVRVLLSRPWLT